MAGRTLSTFRRDTRTKNTISLHASMPPSLHASMAWQDHVTGGVSRTPVLKDILTNFCVCYKYGAKVSKSTKSCSWSEENLIWKRVENDSVVKESTLCKGWTIGFLGMLHHREGHPDHYNSSLVLSYAITCFMPPIGGKWQGQGQLTFSYLYFLTFTIFLPHLFT